MQYRKLGKTGWMVSEIGFGAWGIGGGWGARDDEEALRALERAFDLGVNFVDTAHGYGDGHSERLVAKAVKRCPNRIYVATKVPPKNFRWPASPDIPVTETFPVDWVIKCAEESLQRLETDCIDLLQLHAWADTYNEQLDWYEALVKLREQGKVRFFGVSINDRDPDSALRLVESGRVEAIQLIYNIFHQAPQEKLFPLAIKHDVGIIVRVPLEEGALTGKLRPGVTFHPDDWRKDYFTEEWLREIAERVDKLSFLIRDEIKTIAQAALKFCLSHPAVSTVIPGMRTVAHVEENVAVSDGILLKPEELERLKAHDWPHGAQYPWAAV